MSKEESTFNRLFWRYRENPTEQRFEELGRQLLILGEAVAGWTIDKQILKKKFRDHGREDFAAEGCMGALYWIANRKNRSAEIKNPRGFIIDMMRKDMIDSLRFLRDKRRSPEEDMASLDRLLEERGFVQVDEKYKVIIEKLEGSHHVANEILFEVLDEQERLTFLYRIHEDLSLREVGEKMGFNESRASQIQKSYREKIGKYWEMKQAEDPLREHSF